ncbi:hypothetical protein ACVW1A_005489 [Bradyrhizobium sp. LB1.3]
MDAAGGGLEFLAPACGGDASGGESETGGAAEVCPLVLSCDQTPTKMRVKAKSVALLIRILQAALVRRSTVQEYQDSHGRQSAAARISLPGIWFTKSDRPARTGPGVVSVKEEFNACALTCARHE